MNGQGMNEQHSTAIDGQNTSKPGMAQDCPKIAKAYRAHFEDLHQLCDHPFLHTVCRSAAP